MPRRRLDVNTGAGILSWLTGLPHPVTKTALQVATHAHKQKTSHYGTLGQSHLVNYKKPTMRRTSPVFETSAGPRAKPFKTSKNKILTTNKAMPYRRKSTYKRKSRPRRRRLSIPLAIPRTKIVRFRYVRTGTLTGTSGGLATLMVKANDLNDPMGTSGTALPTSLDQWATMYQKYVVLGSKLTVKFGSTTNTGPLSVGIHLHDNDTALGDANHYREVGRTKMRTLTTQKDFALVQMTYSGKKFWHLSNIKDDSEQEGTFSTTPGSPTDVAYYHIFAQDFFNSNTAVVDYMIEEEFICVLSNPINVAQSSL